MTNEELEQCADWAATIRDRMAAQDIQGAMQALGLQGVALAVDAVPALVAEVRRLQALLGRPDE